MLMWIIIRQEKSRDFACVNGTWVRNSEESFLSCPVSTSLVGGDGLKFSQTFPTEKVDVIHIQSFAPGKFIKKFFLTL